jgi:formylglycine-generating enzyme required for sulfatase activity
VQQQSAAVQQQSAPPLQETRESTPAKPAGREVRPLSSAEELALKPGEAFRECPGCPEMVLIPAGEFIMGSTELPDEKPTHRVRLARALAVGKLEVTFAEWEACVSDGGCGVNKNPGDQGWGKGQRPLINVSWKEAKELASWLSRKTGKSYRLLTEAEWEYAARAGSSSKYAVGDLISTKQARFSNEGWGSAGTTVEAGTFQSNAFGLYDMHGNVWEWVQDCYTDSYAAAPADGAAAPEHVDCPRVLRGGSWVNSPEFLRSAFRLKARPDFRVDYFGFRLARVL